MKVTVAKTAGFCFGVKRAIETVESEIKNNEPDMPIYTYGPIIHNETVTDDLEKRGVTIIPEGEDPAKYQRGTVIIRSHGVSRKVEDELKKAGHRVVDATCPFVKKIHRIVEEYDEKGYRIVITGDKDHPEVYGIMGWIKSGRCDCILSADDFEKLDIKPDEKVCLVSQTTFNHKKFKELVEIIIEKGYDVCAKNTICSATEERQKEAAELAGTADAMIVIGGKSSSNSRKLFEICAAVCSDTYFIQSMSDLDVSSLSSSENVGITAGASTPNKIIEEVQKKCQK
ncbi:MAG: 4-hydroxy-3-methylbut-2-enyl diphosphate reductase [Lachnospiraceae bacterium]|nr:4-hydroxy-3-methylbut-2-enyl diphosphate reductase [Lachnospiraceae bacterium]